MYGGLNAVQTPAFDWHALMGKEVEIVMNAQDLGVEEKSHAEFQSLEIKVRQLRCCYARICLVTSYSSFSILD